MGFAHSAGDNRRSSAQSTLIVAAASALSVILGFGREITTAHFYGTRMEVDAFLNASIIPTVLFGAFNSALIAALVPTFSGYVSEGRTEEVTKLGSTILNLFLITMSALAALGWILAPQIEHVVGRGFPPSEQTLVIQMARILMPGIVAMGMGGVCSAMLNANHRFTASALVWSVANAVTIICVVLLHKELGIMALVIGALLGLFAQLFVQIPSLLQHRLYRLVIDIRHPGLSKVWILLVPISIGSGAAQINVAFDRYFASTLHTGSTAALNYTTKLSFLPNQVIAVAVATVAFPLIARHFASANIAAVGKSISLALRMVSFIVIPCATGLVLLAYPIVKVLFQRGAFDEDATRLCASLIPFATLPLVTISFTTILARASYACNLVRSTVAFASAAVAINVIISATLLPTLGAKGLLLANGIAGLILMTLQITMLVRKVSGFNWPEIISSQTRTAIAAIVMALMLALSRPFLGITAHVGLVQVIGLFVIISGALLTYLGMARVLRVPELDAILTTLRRRSRTLPQPDVLT